MAVFTKLPRSADWAGAAGGRGGAAGLAAAALAGAGRAGLGGDPALEVVLQLLVGADDFTRTRPRQRAGDLRRGEVDFGRVVHFDRPRGAGAGLDRQVVLDGG